MGSPAGVGMPYADDSECPRCGCGSKDLKPEALPVVYREFGKSVELVCQICGRHWLQNRRDRG